MSIRINRLLYLKLYDFHITIYFLMVGIYQIFYIMKILNWWNTYMKRKLIINKRSKI